MISSYRCRLDWGHDGTRRATERGDVLVIVDVLSFSTTVATAVHNGGLIYPCAPDEDLAALAQRIGGEVAVHRRDVPQKGQFSLSPVTYKDMKLGTKVVLASPNGATCSRYANQVPYLFVGALVNAQATALAVSEVLEKNDALNVTVIACGERWKTPLEDGALRFAVEDYLGAGAILSYLQCEKSLEAHVCEGAFLHVRDELEQVLWECESGRDLREMGVGGDVQHAAQLNVYDSAVAMHEDYLTTFGYAI